MTELDLYPLNLHIGTGDTEQNHSFDNLFSNSNNYHQVLPIKKEVNFYRISLDVLFHSVFLAETFFFFFNIL